MEATINPLKMLGRVVNRMMSYEPLNYLYATLDWTTTDSNGNHKILSTFNNTYKENPAYPPVGAIIIHKSRNDGATLTDIVPGYDPANDYAWDASQNKVVSYVP